MHLLNVHTLLLEQFLGSVAPRYAILSHTWADHEAKFEDYSPPSDASQHGIQTHRVQKRPSRTTRSFSFSLKTRHRARVRLRTQHAKRRLKGAGHDKIAACCRQAKAEGYDYVWVDTCCIDKRSSAELSEAINSMFDYYKNADICYVLLADVRPLAVSETGSSGRPEIFGSGMLSKTNKVLSPTQLADLQQSRWFRRGWTLQELLAPQRLEIFDSSWTRIGYSYARAHMIRDQNGGTRPWPTPNLTQHMASISGISVHLLHRGSYQNVSVAERMSWANGRQTTREEDAAYCLLGIFGVNMPLLYGEGSKAFKRLQFEIIKISTDQSILAFGQGLDLPLWIEPDRTASPRPSSRVHPCIASQSCLATGPQAFAGLGAGRVMVQSRHHLRHYYTTHLGIAISLPMMPLGTGEWLAHIDCTLSGSDGVNMPRRLLCLVLTRTDTARNVFHRRSGDGLALVASQYFQAQLSSSIAPPQIYLADTDETAIPTPSAIRVSPEFLMAFQVQTTFPKCNDLLTGKYHGKYVQNMRHNKYVRVYLDCVDANSLSFALQIRINPEGVNDVSSSQTIEVGDDTVCGDETASIWVSFDRDKYSMVELMLNAPEPRVDHDDTSTDTEAAGPGYRHPFIKWRPCSRIGDHEVFLSLRKRWKKDAAKWTLSTRRVESDLSN